MQNTLPRVWHYAHTVAERGRQNTISVLGVLGAVVTRPTYLKQQEATNLHGGKRPGAGPQGGTNKATAKRQAAIAASRVPLSGAVGGRFSGDVVLPLLGRDLCVEVNARADGFRELYSWLASRDVLIVKADRQPPLVVVRLALASEVAGYSGGARPGLKARGWGTP